MLRFESLPCENRIICVSIVVMNWGEIPTKKTHEISAVPCFFPHYLGCLLGRHCGEIRKSMEFVSNANVSILNITRSAMILVPLAWTSLFS